MSIIQDLKNIGAIKYGSFTLKSGIKSDIYVDLRTTISYPKILENMCFEIGKLIIDTDVAVAGVPLGAIPMACIVSNLYDLPMIMIRENRKTYGLCNFIEGNNFDKEIILIEDVVTTGASIMKSIKVLEDENKKIRKIIIILDRENGGVEKIREIGYNVVTLLKLSDLY
jgi:orotate phosphoribosyltransferase